jgi:hypothetical protein
MANTVAGPTFPICKSASGVTLVVTGGVTLFVGFGSPVGVLTLAVFVNVPLAGAVTVTVTFVTWLLDSVPSDQFTVPKLFTPLLLALTNVTPTGNASVTVTLLALDGPKFVTEIV